VTLCIQDKSFTCSDDLFVLFQMVLRFLQLQEIYARWSLHHSRQTAIKANTQ